LGLNFENFRYLRAAARGTPTLFIYSFVDLFICFFISRYQRAAARGDSDAMFSLGVCLFDGIGVAVDEPRALALWEQAAGVCGGGGGGDGLS